MTRVDVCGRIIDLHVVVLVVASREHRPYFACLGLHPLGQADYDPRLHVDSVATEKHADENLHAVSGNLGQKACVERGGCHFPRDLGEGLPLR